MGGELFGANAKHIQRIVAYTDLKKVPHWPFFIMGVKNLRGAVLPVIDSRIKLGIKVTEITLNTCIIVLEIRVNNLDTKVGLLVNEVTEVLEIGDSNIKEPPTLGLQYTTDLITGVFPENEKFIILMDTQKLVHMEACSWMLQIGKVQKSMGAIH